MRYHLWFASFSQKRPHGVHDSRTVTDASGLSPTASWTVRAAAPRGIHKDFLSPVTPTRGLSEQEYSLLLVLFLTVRQM